MNKLILASFNSNLEFNDLSKARNCQSYSNITAILGLGNERNSNEIYAIYVNIANFFLGNKKFRE